MTGLPEVTCPACQITMGLEALLGTANARGVVAIMARAPGTPALRLALLRYVGLFAPAKRQIGWDRAEKLLGEVVALMEAGRIERGGITYAAPLDYWSAALDALFAMPSLRRPLKSHGLLLEILVGLAGKADARAEQQRIASGRGETPVAQASRLPTNQDAGKDACATKPRTRSGTAAGLQSLRDVLAGNPLSTQGENHGS